MTTRLDLLRLTTGSGGKTNFPAGKGIPEGFYNTLKGEEGGGILLSEDLLYHKDPRDADPLSA